MEKLETFEETIEFQFGEKVAEGGLVVGVRGAGIEVEADIYVGNYCSQIFALESAFAVLFKFCFNRGFELVEMIVKIL